MDAQSITLLSIYTGLVGYILLTLFFVYGLVRRITGRAALLASTVTAGWYASLAGFGMAPVSEILELTVYLAWFLFLARILGVTARRFSDPHYWRQTRIALGGIAVYLVGVVVILAAGAPHRVSPRLHRPPGSSCCSASWGWCSWSRSRATPAAISCGGSSS